MFIRHLPQDLRRGRCKALQGESVNCLAVQAILNGQADGARSQGWPHSLDHRAKSSRLLVTEERQLLMALAQQSLGTCSRVEMAVLKTVEREGRVLSAAGVAEGNGALGRQETQETPGAPEAVAPSEGTLGGARGIEGARVEVLTAWAWSGLNEQGEGGSDISRGLQGGNSHKAVCSLHRRDTHPWQFCYSSSITGKMHQTWHTRRLRGLYLM